MSTARLPKSLLATKHVAPLVILASVAVAVVQCAAKSEDLFVLFLILGAIPTLGVTVVAALLARRRAKGSLIAFVLTFAAHIALGIAIVGDGRWLGAAIMAAIACSGTGFLVASPLLIATAIFAQRGYDARGDTFLGIGAAWFAVCELVLHAYDLASRGSVIGGLVVAALIIGITLIRERRRRTFCMRVARGELPGLRARDAVASDPIAFLPIVYGSVEDALTVIEQFSTVDDTYRGTTVGTPIALAPSKYAAIAEELRSSEGR